VNQRRNFEDERMFGAKNADNVEASLNGQDMQVSLSLPIGALSLVQTSNYVHEIHHFPLAYLFSESLTFAIGDASNKTSMISMSIHQPYHLTLYDTP
jgi:hypothetical protein